MSKIMLGHQAAEQFLSKTLVQCTSYLDGVLKFDFQKGIVYRRPRNDSGWERADRPMYIRKPEHYRIVYFSDEDHSFAILAHRLLFFVDKFRRTGCLEWPDEINHKNRKRFDNAASNLEASTSRLNHEHRLNGVSFYPGVAWKKTRSAWGVSRTKFGVGYPCGLYRDTPEARSLACKVADELAAYLDSFSDVQQIPDSKTVREAVFKRLGLVYKHKVKQL